MILPARQTEREIDDCVGKWQPGEKLTCKWWRVRERWSGGEGRGEICGSEQRRCVWCVLVTAQQLHHMSAWEGKGEASPLFSPPFKTPLHWLPDAVAMALRCSGNWRTHTYSQAQREIHGLLAPKLGKDAIISHLSFSLFLFSDCLPCSLVISRLLKIAFHKHPDSI